MYVHVYVRASELRIFSRFHILRLLFPSIFCWYFRYIVSVYANELRKYWHVYFPKLLFISIFCRYIRYFVGTNYMLVGLNVPKNFQMYRQKSEKALWGGGGQLPPPCPHPSGYANEYNDKNYSLRKIYEYASERA